MWIKWKYNDHGWPDFAELEIPEGYDSVKDYISNQGLVPTWSERFCESRIKWEKIDKPRNIYNLTPCVAHGRAG